MSPVRPPEGAAGCSAGPPQAAQAPAASGSAAALGGLPVQAALLDGLDDAAWVIDARTLVVSCANPAAARWLDDPSATWVGRPAESLLPCLEDAAFWAEVRAGHPGSLVSETELPAPHGRVLSGLRRIVPIRARPDEPPAAYLMTWRDRSVERQAERDRERALAELRATLEATADGILVTDLAGGIRAFNRRFAALWSLPDAAMAERDDARVQQWMRLNVTEPLRYQQRLDEIQQHLQMQATDTVTLIDGSRLERHTQPQWNQGRPIGRVYSFRELNRQRVGAPRREHDGHLDEWTGLPHRGGFVTRLEVAVADARQSGAALSVMCIEYDRQALFDEGESACQARNLAELAEGLRAGLRAPQPIARLGGARFGVLLEHCGDEAAEAQARRLLAQARAVSPGALATDGLGLTVGIASYPQAGLSADELLDHAEAALTQALRIGSDCQVHRFASSADSQRQLRLTRALREGLADPQFSLLYQPRCDTVGGQVQAVEALVRWRDAGQGLLLPSQFLPMVERAGLSGALDDWVMEQALRQMQAWRAAGRSMRLGLNVSGWQLTQPGYARRVKAVLDHAQWPAGDLELEIAESALQADPEAARSAVQALQRLGVRVVLDGFGAGEASMALLAGLPWSAVKIDRSLMVRVPRQRAAGALVSAMIRLATSLGIEAIVTGVENEAQRQFAAEQGCDAWQGFLFVAPMPAAQLGARLGVLERAVAADGDRGTGT